MIPLDMPCEIARIDGATMDGLTRTMSGKCRTNRT
jgi:hypothetical protein